MWMKDFDRSRLRARVLCSQRIWSHLALLVVSKKTKGRRRSAGSLVHSVEQFGLTLVRNVRRLA